MTESGGRNPNQICKVCKIFYHDYLTQRAWVKNKSNKTFNWIWKKENMECSAIIIKDYGALKQVYVLYKFTQYVNYT